MSDELIQVIQALWWVAMYSAVNSDESPLAVCIELSATPHGGKPRLTRHVYEIDWARWPQVRPLDGGPLPARAGRGPSPCCPRAAGASPALCSGAKQDFITLGGGKGEIESEAPGPPD